MPERAYRKMVISLKRNSTFVEAVQFCNCCILFSGLSAPPVTCPYRAEQATGLAGGYDCIQKAQFDYPKYLKMHQKYDIPYREYYMSLAVVALLDCCVSNGAHGDVRDLLVD